MDEDYDENYDDREPEGPSDRERNLAEIERLKTEIENLRKCLERQLPEGMMSCSFKVKECVVGHKRLMASNWIDEGCLECAIGHLKLQLREEFES